MHRRLKDMTEPELKELMSLCAAAVEFSFEKLRVENPHFALLVFNDPEIAQYVANCDRVDMVKAFREAADRLDAEDDVRRN